MKQLIHLLTLVGACAFREDVGLLIFFGNTQMGVDSDVRSFEFPKDAVASDLYALFINEQQRLQLYFGQTLIKNDETPIADLGISSDSFIQFELRPLNALVLYQFLVDLGGKDMIPWWAEAEMCWNDTSLPECDQEHVCDHWTGIICDLEHNIESIILNGYKFRGQLSLDLIPAMVHTLVMTHNRIESIDWGFGGLKDKELKKLFLDYNRITHFRLDLLRHSVLEYLSLNSNHIQSVNLRDLGTAKLTKLYMESNRITQVSFEGMENSPLMELYLPRNRIEKVDLSNLKNTNIVWLYLQHNFIEKVDFEQLGMAPLHFLALHYCHITSLKCSGMERSQLNTVYLEYNGLRSIDFTGMATSKVRFLKLMNNPINEMMNVEAIHSSSLCSETRDEIQNLSRRLE